MSILYKNFHINYLEMVNDVFGEEKVENPSVIKEFERFGANVGMWENEQPGFVEEEKFCKNVQKRFVFHRPKILEEKKSENEIVKDNGNIKKIEEKKEIEKYGFIKEDEKDKEKNKINIKEEKDDNKPKNEGRRYYRRNYGKK